MRYRIRLKSVKGRDFPEEFYHFMLGYCLPGMNELLKRLEGSHISEVDIEKYGPIMDQKFAELLNLFSIHHRFVEPHEDTPPGTATIYPPRWDIWSFDIISYRSLGVFAKMKVLAKSILQKPYAVDSFWWNQKGFRKEIKRLTQHILERLDIMDNSSNEILLLKRSGRSELYDKQKERGNLHRYGVERRALIGLEEAQKKFVGNGLNMIIFEPGEYSLVEQIRKFRACSAIVTIRGAELANVMWMKPGTKAVVIDGFGNSVNSPTQILADIMGVKFDVIRIPKNDYPELDGDLIARINKRLEKNDGN